MISENALADLLYKYLTTLEPVERDATLKAEAKLIPQDDGSNRTQIVETKGDAYIPENLSNAMAKAIAKALKDYLEPAISSNIRAYTKSTGTTHDFWGSINPWNPNFITDLNIEFQADEGDFADIMITCHDIELLNPGIYNLYYGACLDGTAQSYDLGSSHAGHEESGTQVVTHGTHVVVRTVGPLTAGTHVLRPYASRYSATGIGGSLRWPRSFVKVYRATKGLIA